MVQEFVGKVRLADDAYPFLTLACIWMTSQEHAAIAAPHVCGLCVCR